MAFAIQDIRSNLKFGGARPTLFNVQLTNPQAISVDLSAAQFMVQASTLPGSTIAPIDIPYFGRKVRIAGDRTFEPWSVTVMNDEDFAVRDALEKWHNRINSLVGNVNSAGEAPEAYKGTALVRQFGKKGGDPIRTYEFVGLFPVEISAIDVNWSDTDAIETFQATFVYDYYRVLKGESSVIIT